MLDMLYFGWKLLREKRKENAVQDEIRREHRYLSTLDTWTGIEMQVRRGQLSYDRLYPWWEYGAYWNGDESKYLNICMGTVQINKEFQKSGLSVEDFCRRYYTKLFQEHPTRRGSFWTCDFNEWERDITLYLDYDKIVRVYPGFNCSSFNIYRNGEMVKVQLEEKSE